MARTEFRADLASEAQPLNHPWEFAIGSGHATLALRTDWQAQLAQCHDELGTQRVRFHGILSDDVGTLVCNQNELTYSFFNVDQIWDFLVSHGMSPFVELSFMPKALASGDQTVFHYAANVTPPNDFGAWAILVRKLVAHAVERYGIETVATWRFEVWNEPNLAAFWTGTQADYFNLYRHTARAIKEIDNRLKVGGPATANNEWIDNFVDFCKAENVPVDFVSTHHYPTDALGTEGQDTEAVLAASRRSLLRDNAVESQRRTRGLPLIYTEWNSSSNPRDPLHDEPYAAACAIKTMMEATFVEGYSFWTFSDIFEENYFPSRPFHGGFGLLNLHGIAKPVYRAFQLLHELGDQQFAADGTHSTLDVWITQVGNRLTALLNNHALPRHPIEAVPATVRLEHCRRPHHVVRRRIDSDHANAKSLWREWGEPEYLNEEQVARLKSVSEMIEESQDFNFENQMLTFDIEIPPHGVAAVDIEMEVE